MLFADKSRFILNTCGRREMVWRRGGVILVTVQDDQFGGWSGMVWGAISVEEHIDLYQLGN